MAATVYVYTCPPSLQTERSVVLSSETYGTCADGGGYWEEVYVPDPSGEQGYRLPSVGEVVGYSDMVELVMATVLVWTIAFSIRWLMDASAGRFG